VRPVAWLCIGPVTHLAEERDLEKFGWRKGLALDEVVHWGLSALQTHIDVLRWRFLNSYLKGF
ncbi:hypothetical protein ACX3VU_09285, partial [Escherichia coli]